MDQPSLTDDTPALTAQERLDLLGLQIAKKFEQAKKDRKASGIEDIWLRCEENYLGIDDENRAEWGKAKWAKPTSTQGGITTDRAPRNETRSTAFVRLTSRYVDCGSAKLQEILIPTDGKVFGLAPTPIPDLVTPVAPMAQAVQGAMPGMIEQPPAGMPPQAGMPAGMPLGAPQMPAPAPVDPAQQADDSASDAAKLSEEQISDWLTEAKYSREARKAIHDGARIGTGVIKGPFSVSRQRKAMTRGNGDVVALQIIESIKPGVTWVDPWNCFPDGACGEDIHNGDFFIERDYLSPRTLKSLKKIPGYLPKNIDKVIKEGPGKVNDEDTGYRPNAQKGDNRYEVAYYYGILDREDMAACEAVGLKDIPEDKSDIFAIITLVNDTVIRAVINPLDSGRFPYRVFNWSRRAGHWAGVGVGEQCDMPQRMINAATRAMMNNAGRSAGSQIVVDRTGITPADKQWEITPDKVWWLTGEGMAQDVRQAFMAVQFPNVTPQMMSIIEYAFRLAEESTNIPLITQGQSGQTTPDTFGATQLQNNNANQLLRMVASEWDDTVTEPLIDDYYEWLLLDPDVPEQAKGDFQIRVYGSELVERAIKNQEILQMGQMVVNPAFELDPAKWAVELLKSWRFDPRAFKLDDEKKAQMANQPPPEAPAVTAAKIRAEAQLKSAEIANQTQQVRIKTDMDRDVAYVNAEHEANMLEHQAKMKELEDRRQLALLEYANQNKLTLDQIKADLAKEASRQQLQRDLANLSSKVDLHKHRTSQVATPAVEPPGRAPDGQAFAR